MVLRLDLCQAVLGPRKLTIQGEHLYGHLQMCGAGLAVSRKAAMNPVHHVLLTVCPTWPFVLPSLCRVCYVSFPL